MGEHNKRGELETMRVKIDSTNRHSTTQTTLKHLSKGGIEMDSLGMSEQLNHCEQGVNCGNTNV
jgi:putative ribosome biogenesis GTPase RsgA